MQLCIYVTHVLTTINPEIATFPTIALHQEESTGYKFGVFNQKTKSNNFALKTKRTLE